MADGETATATAATTTAAATTAAATTPWYEGKLDAEMIGYAQNKGWKIDDAVALAVEGVKAAKSAQAFIGVPENQLLRLPKDASDEAGWKAVNTRLGVPTDAKEYDFKDVKRAGGRDLDEGLSSTMRDALMSAGVRKDRGSDVVKSVVKYLDGVEAEREAVRTAKVTEENAALEKNWGANRAANLFVANQALKSVAAAAGLTEKEATEAADAISSLGGVGAARVLEMFRVIGTKIGEDKFVGGNERQNGNLLTRDSAQARKAELMKDAAWAERYTAGGAAEMREMMSLNVIISGDSGSGQRAA